MMHALSFALALCLAMPVQALTQDEVLSARMLPGWQTATGTHMAALDLKLAPGWKTYWRAPGEAGIPPSFDFSASTNLKSVRFHWPRPAVFDLNGMQTIGYHDHLVLPVEVTPLDATMPVTLRATVDLGVCKDICIPASVTLSADLSQQGETGAIRSALASVPTAAKAAGMTGIGCTVDPIADGLRLTADIGLPDPGSKEVVVFETATSGVWVSQSNSARKGALLTATSDLVPPGGTPFALDRSGVTVTVIAENSAVEINGCPAPSTTHRPRAPDFSQKNRGRSRHFLRRCSSRRGRISTKLQGLCR
ncbi:hypothetical protein HYN69_02645 [Gemmobacter aquarius]|uniref:Thiol:disulfide interchange protein DsbD N-terminal domain-containing protein n=2 Tax=Paragemmobacter aquarius TaxID=2169400 RepID=A0A2S0UQX0_9RHOB|nr:hypothetical protein HYN69_02645 [Gemmobacter aquarius]